MPIEKDNLKKAWRRTLAAENRMNLLNNRVIAAIKRDIKNTTTLKEGTYNYNKLLETKIIRKYNQLKGQALAVGDDLQQAITSLAISTISKASRIDLDPRIIKALIKDVNLDSFSKAMRPSLNEYRGDLLFHLKRGIGKGESVESLARGLLTVDPAKVDVPQYIREMEKAARKALRDPKDFRVFKAALRKNRRFISNLTRAGEPGFQHLGLRRAGNIFLKDIQKAVNDNTIDNVVDEWGKRKLHFIQQRVARTETSRAYHTYLREYAGQADHIKGVEVKLSVSHPTFDICDELAGVYLFETHGNDFPIPPHHPNCICHMIYLFYQDFLNDPDEFMEAA